jgi:hypothetical protein
MKAKKRQKASAKPPTSRPSLRWRNIPVKAPRQGAPRPPPAGSSSAMPAAPAAVTPADTRNAARQPACPATTPLSTRPRSPPATLAAMTTPTAVRSRPGA